MAQGRVTRARRSLRRARAEWTGGNPRRSRTRPRNRRTGGNRKATIRPPDLPRTCFPQPFPRRTPGTQRARCRSPAAARRSARRVPPDPGSCIPKTRTRLSSPAAWPERSATLSLRRRRTASETARPASPADLAAWPSTPAKFPPEHARTRQRKPARRIDGAIAPGRRQTGHASPARTTPAAAQNTAHKPPMSRRSDDGNTDPAAARPRLDCDAAARSTRSRTRRPNSPAYT